jgi:hypothetical protein
MRIPIVVISIFLLFSACSHDPVAVPISTDTTALAFNKGIGIAEDFDFVNSCCTACV